MLAKVNLWVQRNNDGVPGWWEVVAGWWGGGGVVVGWWGGGGGVVVGWRGGGAGVVVVRGGGVEAVEVWWAGVWWWVVGGGEVWCLVGEVFVCGLGGWWRGPGQLQSQPSPSQHAPFLVFEAMIYCFFEL